MKWRGRRRKMGKWISGVYVDSFLVEGQRDGGGNFPRRCTLKMKVNLADPPDLAAYQNQEGRPLALCVCVCKEGRVV